MPLICKWRHMAQCTLRALIDELLPAPARRKFSRSCSVIAEVPEFIL
jgi:hypothetical protein